MANINEVRNTFQQAFDKIQSAQGKIFLMESNRELSLAVTKLDEALMWLNKARDNYEVNIKLNHRYGKE